MTFLMTKPTSRKGPLILKSHHNKLFVHLSFARVVCYPQGRMRTRRAPWLAVALLAAFACAPATSIAPHPFRRLASRPPALRAHLRRAARHGADALPSDARRRGDVEASEERKQDATRWQTQHDVKHRLAPSSPPTARWVEQPVDHFDPLDARTWTQRYFVNDAWFDDANRRDGSRPPVVFLCVGGEGPALGPEVVVTGGAHCALMVDMASKRGALVLALEHRFYGPSQPTGDLSVDSLRQGGRVRPYRMSIASRSSPRLRRRPFEMLPAWCVRRSSARAEHGRWPRARVGSCPHPSVPLQLAGARRRRAVRRAHHR